MAPRDHHVPTHPVRGERCGAPEHRQWGELAELWETGGVCFDCRRCLGCWDEGGCHVRHRPGCPVAGPKARGPKAPEQSPSTTATEASAA